MQTISKQYLAGVKDIWRLLKKNLTNNLLPIFYFAYLDHTYNNNAFVDMFIILCCMIPFLYFI